MVWGPTGIYAVNSSKKKKQRKNKCLYKHVLNYIWSKDFKSASEMNPINKGEPRHSHAPAIALARPRCASKFSIKYCRSTIKIHIKILSLSPKPNYLLRFAPLERNFWRHHQTTSPFHSIGFSDIKPPNHSQIRPRTFILIVYTCSYKPIKFVSLQNQW